MTNSAGPSKYQLLKQKRLELEKRLSEKYNQLQQVIREEAQLTGVYPSDFGSTDLNGGSTQTLRRKIGTSFKLSENLLSHKEDDIQKLLLEKQIQQQICEASLRLASDSTLSKSAIRTHKQNYESAKEKLLAINQNLSKLKKQSQDDINLHKSRAAAAASAKAKAGPSMERHHSVKASQSVTSSPSSPHKQPHFFQQPRSRHDSFSKYTDYEAGKRSPASGGGPLSPSMVYHAHNQQYHWQLAQHFNSPPPQATSTLPYHYHYSPPPQQQQQMAPKLNKKSQSMSNHHFHQQQQQQPLSPSQQYPRRDLYAFELDGGRGGASPDESHQRLKYSKSFAEGTGFVKPSQKMPPPPPLVAAEAATSATPLPRPKYNERIESVQQAPGGYWLSLSNNEKVWYSTENKFSSLDRKKIIKKHIQPPTKSTSMGNIDFLAEQNEENLDNVSITSTTSEMKKREKIWRETSLDEPISITLPPRHYQPTPPAISARVPVQRHPPPPPVVDVERPKPKSIEQQQQQAVERPLSIMVPVQTVSPVVSIAQSPTLSELPISPTVTIVQQGKIQPYMEVTKPFEMSDFYKYSTKFRQKQQQQQQQHQVKPNHPSPTLYSA